MRKTKSEAILPTLKFIFVGILVSVLCLILGYCADKADTKDSIAEDGSVLSSEDDAERVRVIIDAGHGGMDGGAVGADGTLEKDLNLLLSELVYDILSANGIPSVMTRTEDVLLYDLFGDFPEGGKKKMYDLKNRVRFAENYEGAVFVSIHMNSFPDKTLTGLQVYYSPNDKGSEILANSVQRTVGEYLQKDNKREIKPATDSIYILDRIKIPAILIECGFISTETERELLKTHEYRQKLALLIASAVTNYVMA